MPNMELLREKIDDSGLKIYVICDKAGIERATLYNRLVGKGGEWKVSEVLKISEALNLTNAEREEIFLS